MELREIKENFQIDVGAPMPYVLSNEHDTYVVFYKQSSGDELDDKPVTVKFESVQQYKFGSPNDEAIRGHRYYTLGLQPYAIFELIDSDWIEELKAMNRVHPYHSDEPFDQSKHYIFFFHDTCLEVVCKQYEVLEHTSKLIKEEINRISQLLTQ